MTGGGEERKRRQDPFHQEAMCGQSGKAATPSQGEFSSETAPANARSLDFQSLETSVAKGRVLQFC